MIYLVEAVSPNETELLYVVKTRKEAITAASVEAENYRGSGGNGPYAIEVSKWDFDEQVRIPVGSIRV